MGERHLPERPKRKDGKMKVLVAETSWEAMSVSAELQAQDVGVIRSEDSDEFCFLAELAEPTAALFDIRLPGLSVRSAVRKLRHVDPRICLVAIDRSDDPLERARALDAGVDDVVAGTTDAAETVARIRAVVRRRAGRATPRIEVGALTLDMTDRSAAVCGTPMRLTRLEYQLLEFLVLGLGALRGKAAILNHLYSFGEEPDSRTVDAYICRLRGEIARLGGDPSMIRTVWARGYMMSEAVEMPAAA